MKILFVCSANMDRSPTAEYIYANHPGLEVKSAGTYNHAQQRIDAELLQWADAILCMEERHKQSIEEKYPEMISGKIIDFLDVPDLYPYRHPVLIKMIKEKVDAWLLTVQPDLESDSKEYQHL